MNYYVEKCGTPQLSVYILEGSERLHLGCVMNLGLSNFPTCYCNNYPDFHPLKPKKVLQVMLLYLAIVTIVSLALD